MNLMDVIRDNDIIEVTESGVVLVAPRGSNGNGGPVTLADKTDTEPSLRERGYSVSGGVSSYSGIVKGEYLSQLQGQAGLKVYDQMRRSDAQVRSTLRLIKTPVVAGKWYMEPATDKAQDVMIADFVWKNLTQWMSSSWPQMLLESLLMLDFGVWCVDEKTEALTRTGWKTYDRLLVGEEILTFNTESELAEWQALERVNRFEGEFPVLDIETRSHSSRTTMDHNWVVRDYDTKRLKFKKTQELNTNHVFITAAPLAHNPIVAKYGDAFVEALAWFASEGHIKPNGAITLCKDDIVNPSEARDIRQCLTALLGPPRNSLRNPDAPRSPLPFPAWIEHRHNQRPGAAEWYLNPLAATSFLELAPNRVISLEFVHSLTRAQLELFLATGLKGDGNPKTQTLCQATQEWLMPFAMAATLLGKPLTWRRQDESWILQVGKQTEIRPLAAAARNPTSSVSKVLHKGVVWCPTVSNRTWYARRNGTQFFTGNCFEKVFDYRRYKGSQRVVWRKWASRHPVDITDWEYDANGGLQRIKMLPNFNMVTVPNAAGASPIVGEPSTQPVLPIKDLLVFSFDKEAGNAQGMSLLRSAYKPWYFKENLYKIDAIQKERHGIGVPIIKLPPQWKAADRTLADEMGRNLRTNEKAHITLPPMWEISFAELKGQLTNAISSIEHHDSQIAKNVLAGFLNSQDGQVSKDAMDIFLKGTRFIADVIRDVINRYAIPQLVNYNWDVDEYPELKVRRIGETVDLRVLSFALRNFIGADVIRPDDDVEDWVRYEMDMPKPDPDSRRQVVTPQSPSNSDGEENKGEGEPGTQGGPGSPKPPKVGPPRQSNAANMTKSPGRVLPDKSGGS